jgi:hypothetical protein
MDAKYQVGQRVYTSRKIRGWFDYSMQEFVPENTLGTIKAADSEGRSEVEYLVDFGEEFSERFVGEDSLKLG